MAAPPSLGFSRQEHWSWVPFPSPMHESEKWKWSRSVVSDSSRPHGLQPTRLLHLWDFLGKSTGVGCHCLLRSLPLWGGKRRRQRVKENPLPRPVLSWICGLWYPLLAKLFITPSLKCNLENVCWPVFQHRVPRWFLVNLSNWTTITTIQFQQISITSEISLLYFFF